MKQVILLRNDLNMSPGKAAAQAAHAGCLFLIESIRRNPAPNGPILSKREAVWAFENGPNYSQLGNIEYGGMKVIVLGVKNLVELDAYHWSAKNKGLKAFNVFDEGLNCVTACGIGPNEDAVLDDLTRTLELYGKPKERETNEKEWPTTVWGPITAGFPRKI